MSFTNSQFRCFHVKPTPFDERDGEGYTLEDGPGSMYKKADGSTDSSPSPFDEDYYAPDKLPQSEEQLILGLNEYKESAKLTQEKKYSQSAAYLKEALSILKRAKQEKSIGYLYLLKKLAHVSYLDCKYADAEKYFEVATKLVPHATKNPSNDFNTHKNLLIFYTYTNLEKAEKYAGQLLQKSDELLPLHHKELLFMVANIQLLNGVHGDAKDYYRQLLKMNCNPELKAQVLNNLAFSSWMHLIDIKKMEDKTSQEAKNIVLEAEYVESYLKESILINELR